MSYWMIGYRVTAYIISRDVIMDDSYRVTAYIISRDVILDDRLYSYSIHPNKTR